MINTEASSRSARLDPIIPTRLVPEICCGVPRWWDSQWLQHCPSGHIQTHHLVKWSRTNKAYQGILPGKKPLQPNIPFHCWAWEISNKNNGFHRQQGVIISPYFTGLQGRCRSLSLWPFRKQRICLAPGAKVMGFLRETSKINLEGRLKTFQIELFGINFTSTWVKIRFMFPWKIGSNSTQRRVEEWRL